MFITSVRPLLTRFYRIFMKDHYLASDADSHTFVVYLNHLITTAYATRKVVWAVWPMTMLVVVL